MRLTQTKRKATSPKRRGFTLVELMASIGIIIFILAVTAVAFGPMTKSAGLKNASRMVRNAIDGARVRAIQQRRRVRFETQVLTGTTGEQWRVTTSGGDPLTEWPKLPEFVAVRTNTGGKSYDTKIQALSITFGPDGSVARVVVDGSANESPTEPFRIRVGNLRETDTQDFVRYVEVYPLTGGTLSLDGDEKESF